MGIYFQYQILSEMEIAIILCIGSETNTHFPSLSTLNILTQLFSKSFILSIDYQYSIQYSFFNPVAATQCTRQCRLFIPLEITATSQLYAIYIYLMNDLENIPLLCTTLISNSYSQSII